MLVHSQSLENILLGNWLLFVANTAGEASVSFDFRVIPWSVYREDRAAAKKSNHNLRLGSYYAIMDAREAAP